MNWATRLLCLLSLASSCAFGQQRPLLTEDPRIITNGTLVTETGFAYYNHARFPLSRAVGDQFSIFHNGLNFGLGPRAEFQMSGVLHNFVKVRENGSGWLNDWGDFSLSTKIKILDETTATPIISFRPTVVLPNTSQTKGIGTDGTHFFGNILFGKNAGRTFFFGNVGLGILDDAVRAGAQQDVLTYGVAAMLPISPRISLLSEWNGWKNPQEHPTPGGESRSQFRLGAQLRAGGVRWDIGGMAGLTRLDARKGVVFGLTKEFRLWK